MLTRVESETESTPVLQSCFSVPSLLASLVSKCRPLMGVLCSSRFPTFMITATSVTTLDWVPERVSPPLESLLNYRPKNLDVGLKRVKVAQSCPTLCDPKELYSLGNAPHQNTGVGSHSLLQGIFPIQGSNPGLPHYRQILYQLSHQGSPKRVIIYKSSPNTDS